MTARFLGPEGKGLIYLIIVSISLIVTLASFGLGPASIYFVGKDRRCINEVVCNLLISTFGISIGLLTVGWLMFKFGQLDILSQFPSWTVVLVFFLIPVHLLQGFLMQLLSAMLRINAINMVEIAKLLTQLLFFLLFVLLARLDFSGAFLAYVVATSGATAVYLVIVLYETGLPKKPNWKILRSCAQYGAKAYVFDVLRLLNIRLNVILLMTFAENGAESVGMYSVAIGLAELILFVPSSIRLILFPTISAGGNAEADRLTPIACRQTLLLTILMALAVAILGPFLVHRVYGDAFSDAIIPLLILLPAVLILSQALILYGDLNGRGYPGATALSTLASLSATIAFGYLLIPRYGLIGAALTSLLSYGLEYVTATICLLRSCDLRFKEIFRFRLSDLTYYLPILPGLVRERIERAALGK
jgi:O-antigen/teichoic acid export membrane protein